MSKNKLIKPKHLFFCIRKKLFNPQRVKSNRCVSKFSFFHCSTKYFLIYLINACISFSIYYYYFIKNTLKKLKYLIFLPKKII